MNLAQEIRFLTPETVRDLYCYVKFAFDAEEISIVEVLVSAFESLWESKADIKQSTARARQKYVKRYLLRYVSENSIAKFGLRTRQESALFLSHYEFFFQLADDEYLIFNTGKALGFARGTWQKEASDFTGISNNQVRVRWHRLKKDFISEFNLASASEGDVETVQEILIDSWDEYLRRRARFTPANGWARCFVNFWSDYILSDDFILDDWRGNWSIAEKWNVLSEQFFNGASNDESEKQPDLAAQSITLRLSLHDKDDFIDLLKSIQKFGKIEAVDFNAQKLPSKFSQRSL